jgi:hypothetical protein
MCTQSTVSSKFPDIRKPVITNKIFYGERWIRRTAPFDSERENCPSTFDLLKKEVEHLEEIKRFPSVIRSALKRQEYDDHPWFPSSQTELHDTLTSVFQQEIRQVCSFRDQVNFFEHFHEEMNHCLDQILKYEFKLKKDLEKTQRVRQLLKFPALNHSFDKEVSFVTGNNKKISQNDFDHYLNSLQKLYLEILDEEDTEQQEACFDAFFSYQHGFHVEMEEFAQSLQLSEDAVSAIDGFLFEFKKWISEVEGVFSHQPKGRTILGSYKPFNVVLGLIQDTAAKAKESFQKRKQSHNVLESQRYETTELMSQDGRQDKNADADAP